MKIIVKNISKLLKESEEVPPASQAGSEKKISSDYRFEYKGQPHSIKLLAEQDDEGKTYYWPIPVRKQGEGVPDEDNEALKDTKGGVFDWAFPLDTVIAWTVEYLGERIDSSELYDKKAVIERFGKKVAKTPPRLDIDQDVPETDQGAAAKPGMKPEDIETSGRFSAIGKDVLDPATKKERDVSGKPQKFDQAERFRKLEVDTDEDKQRLEAERKAKQDKEFAKINKESKKIPSSFTDLIIERLKKKLNESLKKK